MNRDISETEKLYSFQKKEWIAYRIAWTIMGLIVVAAALGLFGKGLLSNNTHTRHGVKIQYNRFMRVEKDTELLVNVSDLGKDARISFNNHYLNKVRIEQVTPEPKSVEIKNNQLVYTFSSLQNGFVIFYLNPQKMGFQRLELTVNGKKMHFDQYIYF